MLAEAEVCGDLADQLPVRARISCGRDGGRKQGEVALRVDHHGIGLRPERGGQHDVGEPVCRCRLVGVLGDDQLGGLQARDHGRRFATVATGLVQMIQHALISPAASCSNMATVPGPTSSRIVPAGRPHCCSTKSRSPADATER